MFDGAFNQSNVVFQSELGFETRSGSLDLEAAALEWYQSLEEFQATAREKIRHLQELGLQLEYLDHQINVTRQKTYFILQNVIKPVKANLSEESKAGNEADRTMQDQELISKLQIDRQFAAMEPYLRSDEDGDEVRAERFLERMRSAWLSDYTAQETLVDGIIEDDRVGKFLEELRENWHRLCKEADNHSDKHDESIWAQRFLEFMQMA